ncbi:uncharacterized protein LOC123533840 [Mercenaria mercenaria]|uniref:uncharacterized protein LOC123533840 n=1 Tax=Mercenaria mercenaria TaxID=6596 RepID=UPI00234EB67D|nr:uncharacterized protein LOC123533840 [Mercenaria mercenaria]
MTMKVFQILVLLVVLAVKYGKANVEPLEYLPTELQGYLDDCHSVGDLRNQSGQMVFWRSMQMYISKFAVSVSNVTVPEKKLFESTLYQIIRPLLEPPDRRKRQVTGTRIRREVRVLTFTERRRYFAAVNAMKFDRRLNPSVYDFLARLHTGSHVGMAHMGPAFPSWHRLYLYIFESILRLWYDSTVTVPFWASVFDNEMLDPTRSVLFSNEFFGNGYGIVQTGPFGNWTGPPIRRNIGGTRLMSNTVVERILSRRRNSEILAPTALPAFDLEAEHGFPHVYVGGNMNNLNNAPFDPLFFSHHAYIDYIWELFRKQQREQIPPINPETDYPFDVNDPRFRPSHNPNANAGFVSVDTVAVLGIQLAALTQRVGYSNAFFNLVQYIDAPVCPNCDNSPFLYCEPSIARCVSRDVDAIIGLSGNNTAQTTTQLPTAIPQTTEVNTQATQQTATGSAATTNPSVTSTLYPQTNTGGNFTEGMTATESAATTNPSVTSTPYPQTNTGGNFTEGMTATESAVTTNPSVTSNPYTKLNSWRSYTQVTIDTATTTPGVTSIPYPQTNIGGSCKRQPFIHDVDTKQMGRSNDWAYIPVNVVSKRPPSMTGYMEYSLYKTQTKWTNQTTLGYKYEFIQAGQQYQYEGCSKRQDVVGKIDVISWGLNYDGYAQEYVIVDNRYGVSQANGYLPVKRPSANNPSEFITVAYDSCGRVCKPYSNDKNNGNINGHFGGGFRVSIDSPKQYSNSYEEAMLGMWEVTSPSFSPVIDYGYIPITFYCGYTEEWIWDKPPSQTQPPQTKTQPPQTKTQPPQTQPPPTPPAFYYQTPTNDRPVVVVPKQQASNGGSTRQSCVVATDCTIDVPCRNCADFDYEYCRGQKKIAVCIYGQFSVTATTNAHLKHFYSTY